MQSYPDGFTFSPLYVEMYEQIERIALPALKAKSRRLSSTIPTIDYDDAMQEGRIAILTALPSFDLNRGGKLESYLGVVITNTYLSMAYEALTLTKVPHVHRRDPDGVWVKKPIFPISLDAALDSYEDDVRLEIPDDGPSPEILVSHRQLKSDVGKLTMKMYNTLGGKDLKVFRCKVHPPSDFLDMLYMDGVNFVSRGEDGVLYLDGEFEITNLQIAKYLGLKKNTVDWSLYKVRKLFTKIAKYDLDFSELYGDTVVNKRWTMIQMSKGTHEDLEFIRKTLDDRCLATIQTEQPSFQSSKKKDKNGKPYWSRLIKWYGWGCTMALKRGARYITLVIEGRFNPLTGVVFGQNGSNEDIPLNWYMDLVKEVGNAK